MHDSPPSEMFSRSTSVFLCGDSRPLLNWVAYALIAAHSAGLVWTNIQLEDEVPDDADLLSTKLLPPDRFLTVSPKELAPDDFAGNVALGGLVRSDEPPDVVRRFADFLRLPLHTQALLSRLPRDGTAVVLVLSNGHRIAALYTTATVAPTVRSIVEAGASLLMTWADAPPGGRLAFEHVLHLRGNAPAAWRDAVLRVEKGSSSGPLRTGAEFRLGDWPMVASILGKSL